MERTLLQDVNEGVNLSIQLRPGFAQPAPPALTLARKYGTSSDLALLKLSILARKGIPMQRLMLGTCYRDRHYVAIVKSSCKSWWFGKKHPCLLVLDCHTNRIYRLLQTRYGVREYSLAISPYAAVLLSAEDSPS